MKKLLLVLLACVYSINISAQEKPLVNFGSKEIKKEVKKDKPKKQLFI